MKPRLTTYYDPDNPPRASRRDEADRLLGKTVGRAIIYFLYVFAVGGKVSDALFSLIDIGGWQLALGVLILVWSIAPMAIGVEHMLIRD